MLLIVLETKNEYRTNSQSLNAICLPMKQHLDHKKQKHCCILFGKKENLNHMISVKTDTLNCNSCASSIQCERTSFLASFARSAGEKNIFRGCFFGSSRIKREGDIPFSDKLFSQFGFCGTYSISIQMRQIGQV